MHQIGVVGLSYRHAGVDDIARFSLPKADVAARLPALRDCLGAGEVLYLGTCNRVEVLYTTLDGSPAEDGRAEIFRALIGREPRPGEANRILRAWTGEAALEHLFLVACGLDSAQAGEQEIAAQLRGAWEISRAANVSGPTLDRLVGEALGMATRVRHIEAGVPAPSLADLAADRVLAHFGLAWANAAGGPAAASMAHSGPMPLAGAPSAEPRAAQTPSTDAPSMGLPPAQTPLAGAPSAGLPPAQTPSTGARSAGLRPAQTPLTGAPSTGLPPAQTPLAGAPSAGLRPALTLSMGAPSAGLPPAQTPLAGAPSMGLQPAPTPSAGGHVRCPSAALLGVSPMTKRCALVLHRAGVPLVVVNRTLEVAEEFAQTVGGRAVSLDQFRADPIAVGAVVLAAGGGEPVLDSAALSRLRRGSDRPPLLVDFGVPPNVDPQAARAAGLGRVGMDELIQTAQERRLSELMRLAPVRAAIDERLALLRDDLAARAIGRKLADLRGAFEQIAADEADRALGAELRGLDEPQREQLRRFASTVARRLAHLPIAGMRAIAAQAGADAVDVFFREARLRRSADRSDASGAAGGWREPTDSGNPPDPTETSFRDA